MGHLLGGAASALEQVLDRAGGAGGAAVSCG